MLFQMQNDVPIINVVRLAYCLCKLSSFDTEVDLSLSPDTLSEFTCNSQMSHIDIRLQYLAKSLRQVFVM